jgi:hypothetical protein
MEYLRSTRRHALNPRAFASWFFALCGTALMTVSCAHTKSYIEPVASEQTAVLQVDVPLWLISVDGEKVSNGIGLRDRKEVRVRQGRHKLELSLAGFRSVMAGYPNGSERMVKRSFQSVGTAQLDFLAWPGYTYVVSHEENRVNEDSFRWKATINEFKP